MKLNRANFSKTKIEQLIVYWIIPVMVMVANLYIIYASKLPWLRVLNTISTAVCVFSTGRFQVINKFTNYIHYRMIEEKIAELKKAGCSIGPVEVRINHGNPSSPQPPEESDGKEIYWKV